MQLILSIVSMVTEILPLFAASAVHLRKQVLETSAFLISVNPNLYLKTYFGVCVRAFVRACVRVCERERERIYLID